MAKHFLSRARTTLWNEILTIRKNPDTYREEKEQGINYTYHVFLPRTLDFYLLSFFIESLVSCLKPHICLQK
jgi:hypothetical protein